MIPLDAPKYITEHLNPLTELCELRLRAEQSGKKGTVEVFGTLKLDSMSLTVEAVEYRIGLSKAYLSLKLSGFDVVMGTLLGEIEIAAVEHNEVHSERTGASYELNAKSNTGDHNYSLGASAAAETSARNDTTRKKTNRETAIRSLPNNRWEITVPTPTRSKEWIKGAVISNSSICRLDSIRGANTTGISADVTARKLDVEVDTVGGNAMARRMRLYRNKEAVVGVLVAKSLSREIARNNSESDEKYLVVSRCEVKEFS